MTSPTRRLAAIMFTDIVGYTALMAESEERGLRAREKHRTLAKPVVERYGGEWIDEWGDESLSSFPSAVNAANCALAIQEKLKEEPELRLRIGIHLGDVVFEGGTLHGDGVNVASRVRPLAEPGGVCVSEQVHDSIKSQPNLALKSLGEQRLKNVEKAVTVYCVTGTPSAPADSVTVSRREAPAEGQIRSLAVLPLENLSGDPEQEYFSDGMTDAVISEFARIRALSVVSRTSVMQYKRARKPLPEIARELGVDAVIEGTVLRAGDRVRITVQLIDAPRDRHLWSEHYDRDLSDVLALYSDVARAVAEQVRLELTPEEQEILKASHPVDPPAYDDYLRGRQHLNAYTEGGTRKAIEYFDRALAKDPDFARAHAGLSDAYTRWYGFGIFSPEESRAPSTMAARRALELAPELAEAHTSVGFIQLIHDWDFEAADRSWRRAMEIAPSLVEPRLWHVNLYLLLSERIDEALREMPGVLALDPLSPMVQTNAAMLFYFARRHDEAASRLEEILQEQPDYQYARLMLARTYIQQRRYGEAARELEDWLVRRGEPAPYGGAFTVPPEGLLGYVRSLTGSRPDARALLHDLEARSRSGSAWPLGIAVIHMGLGELDQAFAWLDRAVESHRFDHWVKVDPLYDPIRSDPRFDDLLRRIGFPES